MTNRRLLSDRGAAGRTWYHEQPDGTFWIEHEQDVEPEVEYAKMLAGNVGPPAGRDGVVARHVAHIPNIFILKWLREGIDIFSPDPDQRQRLAAKLNDPDYRDFRVIGGRI